ncbi:MAG: hypothetical protein HZA68_12910 [Rhodovulum sp.]|nr:hypothetical protein [Rhodovulum sp.]
MPNPSFAASEAGLNALWAKASIRPERRDAALAAARRLLAARPRYDAVAKRTGVPWWWIACAHWRESNANFSRHLHNGDPLTGYTVHVPPGRPRVGHGPPFTWEESAVDALAMKRLDQIAGWSIARALYQWERFNGTGYIGQRVNSPYLFAGTSLQQRGKYVRDGVWDASHWDSQLGTVALLKALLQLDPTILTAAPPPAAPPGVGTAAAGLAAGLTAMLGDHPTLTGAAMAALVVLAVETAATERGRSMIKYILTNWKTSSAGGGIIMAAAWALVQSWLSTGALDPTLVGAFVIAVLNGLGLVAAKDADVTGGTKPNAPDPAKGGVG